MRVAALVIMLAAVLGGCGEPDRPEPEPSLSDRLGAGDDAGFARALEPRRFAFPADHGPHPDYRNEWWYFTGNLAGADGRRFGYQLTLFRIALIPQAVQRASAWATRDVWMGHLAVSDAARAEHRESERFARGAAGLAGAQTEPLRIWLDDWVIASPDGQTWRLQAAAEDIAVDLELTALRAPTLQGDAGLSRKSAQPGNASYYYSITRLATRGEVRLGADRVGVAGLSWLDREWSTSALAEDQAGWDWFALQFEDGRDVMYYRLRRSDGTTDPMSSGSLLAGDGSRQTLNAAEVALTPLRWWRAEDGTDYPVAWLLALGDGPPLRVEAVFDDQRMDVSVRYWEGMVRVLDAAGAELLGRGYMELAGY
ncbi:MAG: lipocalin-like domain-containing protein [Gammaproteobacteria bacterium]